MSGDEDEGKSAAAGGDVVSPSAKYQPFVVMEELLDKLKLLHYEDSFCKQLGHKPFSRHYFAIKINSGEQFFAFTSIAAWLLQMSGKHVEQPQENDDPNATISLILDELKQLGHKPDFAPHRLKTGFGECCLWVLDRLADETLKAKNFSWKSPVYPEEEADEENIMEDDSEMNLNKVEEDLFQEDDEIEEEEHVMMVDDLQRKSGKQDQGTSSKPEVIMESNTDSAEWKLEVERVLPQLKLTIRADNKDWRNHLDQMHQHTNTINASLAEMLPQLNKLQDEISRTLEKIGSRETYVNNQLEHHLQDYRGHQDELAEIKERYRQASGGVTELTRKLAEVSDELDHTKQEMEERGSSMTDGAPLARIRQAMGKLKQECLQMDIRTGVLQHMLLRARLKEKNLTSGVFDSRFQGL